MPNIERQAQNERAQISLMDEQFAAFMNSLYFDSLDDVFSNELQSIDLDVKRLQVAYLNTILMSPIDGIVTGIYKNQSTGNSILSGGITAAFARPLKSIDTGCRCGESARFVHIDIGSASGAWEGECCEVYHSSIGTSRTPGSGRPTLGLDPTNLRPNRRRGDRTNLRAPWHFWAARS
jgi:hypothetical protein